MPREHADYRDTIEQLNRYYPGRELLTLEEVGRILGYYSESSVRKHVPVIRGKVSKVALAKYLCQFGLREVKS